MLCLYISFQLAFVSQIPLPYTQMWQRSLHLVSLPTAITAYSSVLHTPPSQSLAHFCHDGRSSMFLPNSCDYLHNQITSFPSTPHYLYLEQGRPARTAWRAALLGSNQAKATFLFIKSIQRTVATLMTA